MSPYLLQKKRPKIYVVYAISICEYILNPSNQQIQVFESAIKFLISKYLQKVLNKEKLVSLDEDETITTSITTTASKKWRWHKKKRKIKRKIKNIKIKKSKSKKKVKKIEMV